jgi:hypothetical protein
MRAVVPVNTGREYCVPESAVVNFEGTDYVFAEKSGTEFEIFAINTGQRADGWVSIQGNDALYKRKLVTVNAYTLLMALKNKPE